MEDHSVHGHLGLQLLEQVPGNRFTLAVFVRCEIESVRRFEKGLQFLHHGATAFRQLIRRLKTILNIDGQSLAREVRYVANRCSNIELWT